MSPAATYQQTVAAQGASRQHLTDLAVATATTTTRGFSAWYDDAAVQQWAARLAGRIQAIQRQTAALTDAYLTAVARHMTGRPLKPAGPVDIGGLRQGTTATDVYARVAEQYRYARYQGADDAKALESAIQRADVLADTDVALAARAQAQRFMVVHRVDGFRRVIHPELSRGGTCGLCIAAADRIYHRSELMPIHDRCACSVAPIINGVDPGHQLNRSDLTALYKQAGGTQAEQLSKVRITVHHHGELGPLLTTEGQHFRGPGELPQAS